MKMRIVKLIYQAYLPHQGRYPRVSGQSKILKEAGHDVTILACDRTGTEREREIRDGISVERIRIKTGEMRGPLRQLLPLLRFYGKAYRWLRKKNFDMIHCHNLDVLPLGVMAKRAVKAKLVFDAHEPNYYALWPKRWGLGVRILDRMDAFLSKRADAVTVTNSYQVKKYREIGVRKVELIGNYPQPELRSDPGGKKVAGSPGVTFGRLGTFYRFAGVEETLEAFRRLAPKHPEARLLLGGRAVKGYEKEFLRLLARHGRNVEYIGAYEAKRMPKLYGRIDISCLIYPKNNWFRNITPRKFFDSLANGVPVIMTDIGGLGDVVRERKCGLIVDEKDIDGICEAMEIVVKEPARLEDMSRAALELAESEYSWRCMAAAYRKLVQELHAT